MLRAEAGLSLAELNRLFMPRGWFTPVTPGTKFVTLGGMVATDVHGKNHHRAGCFGAHVRALRCASPTTASSSARPTVERDLFCATLGGMGLTGHILEVEFSCSASRRRGSGGERAHPRHRRVPRRRSTAAPARLADDRGLDRLPVSGGSALGRGILIAGAGRRRRRRRPGLPRGAAQRSRFPFDVSRTGARTAQRARLQHGSTTGKHIRAAEARHRHARDVLLPARRDPALEPRLRAARLHAVPVRAARAPRAPRRCAALPRGADRRAAAPRRCA